MIIGSKSDQGIGDVIHGVLRSFGIEVDYRVLSAHRDPEALEKFIESSDAEVFIAVAGLSAALPGFIASRTLRPVIGVPRAVKLGGLDSLLSIVQMPPGIPVACVGIDSGKNAALLAVEILSLKYADLARLLTEYREKMAKLK